MSSGEHLLPTAPPSPVRARPRLRRHPLLYLIPVTVCVLTAAFGQYQAATLFVINRTCLDMFGRTNATICSSPLDREHEDAVTARAAVINGWTVTSSNIFTIFTTPWIAAVSDLVGRRPVILFCVCQILLQTAGTLAVAYFSLNLWWLVPINLPSGGIFPFIGCSFAWLADASTARAHTHNFSALEASFFVGGVVGPLVAGWLTQTAAAPIPFLAATGTLLLVLLYVCRVLPETVADARLSRVREVSLLRTLRGTLSLCGGRVSRRAAAAAPAAAATTTTATTAAAEPPRKPRALVPLWPWVLIFGVVNMGMNAAGFSIMASYARDYISEIAADTASRRDWLTTAGASLTRYTKLPRFGFSAIQFSLLTASNYCAKGVYCTLLLPLLLRYHGTEPRGKVRVVIFASAAGCVAMLGLGSSRNAAQLFAFEVLEGLDVLCLPVIRSMVSAAAPPETQGATLGLVAMVEGLSQMVGPTALGYIWASSVNVFPAACFVAVATIDALACLGASCIFRPPVPFAALGAPEGEAARAPSSRSANR